MQMVFVALEKGRCRLPVKVKFWRKADCCGVEVNLATLTSWGYYQILYIGVACLNITSLLISLSVFTGQ